MFKKSCYQHLKCAIGLEFPEAVDQNPFSIIDRISLGSWKQCILEYDFIIQVICY